MSVSSNNTDPDKEGKGPMPSVLLSAGIWVGLKSLAEEKLEKAALALGTSLGVAKRSR